MRAESVFADIEPLLIDAIPKSLRSIEFEKQLCIVRVYYYDTHAPCAYVDFRCISAESREEIITQHGDDALYYLWTAGEESGEQPSVCVPDDPMSPHPPSALGQTFRNVYELLCKDEEKYMVMYRDTLYAVTRKLNDVDWNTVIHVTDDFAIAPADGSAHFCNDENDLLGGIPLHRIELLQTRGYLGPAENLRALR